MSLCLKYKNFPEILSGRARSEPLAHAYRFFQGATLVPETLTFHDVWEQSASLAYLMQSQGLSGQRVLLICKSQRYFVIAFFASLLVGAVAVPTALPRRQVLLDRLQVLTDDAQVCAIISDGDDVQLSQFTGQHAIGVQIDMRAWAARDDHAANAACWTPPELGVGALAFLQYTSGSTGDPKGVAVTHDNLVDNCAVIAEGMGMSSESLVLTALPLFHDMGLIGGVLQSMYSGCCASCMSPAEFVQYPERWLQIISTFKITVSGGPNFMYELAARSVDPLLVPNLDLSSWQVAFCGAEPIRPAAITGFIKKFAPFGFRPSSFYACYGMAESTLFITGASIGVGLTVDANQESEVVCCGSPRLDTQVAIVDPDRCQRMADECVGEIWVSGSSVASGYWRRAALTEQYFKACIDGDETQYYLRTGDLGYLKDGQLYVTGRLKDLIIAYGKKYLPQDIEDDAQRSHAALRESCGAAFGVTKDAQDRTVLVFELKREWLRRQGELAQVVSVIRKAVGASLGLSLDEIVFIKPGALPRTSSGKVRRSQCRLDYLGGKLERVEMDPAKLP
jgi:acyl-CoA synthetase (AMP-forming)/AMP-acid ligase II